MTNMRGRGKDKGCVYFILTTTGSIIFGALIVQDGPELLLSFKR